MCVDILPVHIFVHYVSAIPQRPEDGIKSPGTRITDSYESPHGWPGIQPVPAARADSVKKQFKVTGTGNERKT